MEKNKLNFGLTRLAWSPITRVNGVDTYGAVHTLPDARAFNAAKNGEMFEEWANGGSYYKARTNMGYNITLELVHADEDFRRYILSEEVDAHGVQAEYGETKVNRFALLVEFLGDDHYQRRVFYDCTADRPDVAGTTANDNNSKTSYRDQISIIASPRINDKLVTVASRADVDQTVYDNWFNTVYQPEGSGYAAITVTVTDGTDPVVGALVTDSAGNQALTNSEGKAYLYELPGEYSVFGSFGTTKGTASVTLTGAGAAVNITLA